jgi:2-polyprenyl-3-methyl-5-hydroxy-6-metoxy-1,4-benzoquinol methylase
MDKWKEAEFHYARQLRESSAAERHTLYTEAYSAVSKLALHRFASDDPEDRTAGTSRRLVQLLSQVVDKHDHVLEIGCGRGYTCLKLAPYVMSMVGVDVSEPSVIEARETLSQGEIENVRIKEVSALELADHFSRNEFDVCISIDVLEHLHPEDAKEHLQQVFHVLKPGGKYIVIMPNRLTGPHDITREEFPEAREALGFHLNESTYREMIDIMEASGFNKCRALYGTILSKKDIKPIVLPGRLSIAGETLYRHLPNLLRYGILRTLISIRLIAYKPTG